ncbi:hypothetical protein Tco_0900536 [Tanacetum coccineum]
MLLLTKAITQNFSNPTNNRLRASSNTRNQAVVQGDMVNIQSRNSSNVGRNNQRAYVQGEVVEGMNATNKTANVQRIVRTPTPGNTSTDASRMGRIEELSANICLMARIQPADQNFDDEPSYESAFEPLVGMLMMSCPNNKRFAQKVQQQNETLTSQIEMYKERNRVLENITKDNNYLKEFLEVDEKAKRFQKQADSQLYHDREIIRNLEKQQDELSQEVKHFKQKNEVWISQKSQENSQKRASTDTRIRRVQKEAKESKPKPEKSSLSQIMVTKSN